jgi:hypothetical protein
VLWNKFFSSFSYLPLLLLQVLAVKLQSMAAGSIEKEPVTKKLPASFQVWQR